MFLDKSYANKITLDIPKKSWGGQAAFQFISQIL